MRYVKKKFTKEYFLKLETRILIYQFISKNPGLHFRELARRLNIPRSTLRYHLNHLTKQELLVIKKDDNYSRYFIAKDIGDREKKILSIIRTETTRDVLLYIMIMVSASRIEIARELEKDPTTIKFHLKRLLKYSIIEQAPTKDGIVYTSTKNLPKIKRKKSKNEIFYRLKEPEIDRILIMYYKKGHYHDIIAEAICTYINEAMPIGTPVNKIRTAKETAETVEKILFDVLPHPYHA